MTVKEALFKLLRIALGNESDLSWPADASLQEVVNLSESMGINGLAIDGLQILSDNGTLKPPATWEEKAQKMDWLGFALQMEETTSLQWKAIQRLVDFFARNGITTIGLKGVTVGQWYPNPMNRDSCDFDCILLKDEADGTKSFAYEEGNKLIEAQGIHVDRSIYVHSIFECKDLLVENHQYLAAVKLSKRHRAVDELLRSMLVNEPLTPVADSKLMMGSPMFNAVFLTHHAHRHMLNDYLPIKLLADWALFIKNNESLDWTRYWEYMEEFGMLRFAQSMTRLAKRLLGARVPFELPVDEDADTMLEESIWDYPEPSTSTKSLFARRVGIISKLVRARKRYRVFYDCSAFAMIWAYVKGHFFGVEE